MDKHDPSILKRDVLCGFGLDVEKVFAQHRLWLEGREEKYLVFLDTDPRKAPTLFSSDKGREILSHPRVRYYLLERGKEEEVFRNIAWEFVFLRFGFFPIESDEGKSAYDHLRYFLDGVHSLASFYADRGVQVIGNLWSNAEHLSEAFVALEGKDSFKGIPAVICGAGPSLSEHLPQLKEVQDRALFFGGGSALSALSKGGIRPNFAASIDPNPPYRRFAAHSAFEVPFFYLTRLSQEIFRLVHAPLHWVATEGVYPFEKWMTEKLGFDSRGFDAGWNVVTFSLSLARYLGCDPIVLVGVDLAADGEQTYAGETADVQEEDGWIRTKQGNKEVLTKRDFLVAARWIDETFASSDRTLISTSKEGLELKSAKKLIFEEVVKLYLHRSFDLEGWVHSELFSHTFPAAMKDKVDAILLELEKSLNRSHHFCEEIVKQIGASFPKDPMDNGKVVIADLDLQDEIAYQKILQPLWDVWRFVFLRRKEITRDWEHGGYLNKILFWQNTLARYLEGREE